MISCFLSVKPIRKTLLCLCLLPAGLFVLMLLNDPADFVLITVEESSTSVLQACPLAQERIAGMFLDETTGTLIFEDNPNLTRVNLVLHYTAVSQGIEYWDQLVFSRKNVAVLKLSGSLSKLIEGPDGKEVEAVENRARVVSGDFEVTRFGEHGCVHIRYGSHEFSLAPGESWAQLLAMTPCGKTEILPEDWENRFDLYVKNGYPITRVAVTNRGLWPKDGSERGCGE